MRFEILGPLVVRIDANPVRMGGPRERKALAALLLAKNRPVSAAQLTAALWGDEPPRTAKAQLHNCVAALRRALGAQVPIRRDGSGFTLDLLGHELDLAEFSAWATEADALADRVAAVRRYRAALGLWRGPALDGLTDGALAAAAQRLEEQRLACLERCLAMELDLGIHMRPTTELAALIAEHPLRESLVEIQMRAQWRTGRRAEALATYAEAQKRLADELGVDPGAELRQLHTAILRDQGMPADPHTTVPVALSRPGQLPPATRHFVGRQRELAELDTLADEADRGSATVIPVVTGSAGVGKTTLALHWARRLAHRFPDGQLYLNLRGFDPSGSPMPLAEAVRRLLDAFAVPPERIPVDPEAQAGMYRSLIAGRRVLVVLDNARGADQVRPLLPGSTTCLVVVTSRHQLAELVVTAGAHPITLTPFTADESVMLLRRHLGTERIAAVAQTTLASLADSCAHLPLALAIVAARASVNPRVPLTTLASELADEHDRLDALDAGTQASSVRAVLSSSYHAVSDPAQRLFRLLGVHCGPDISSPAAASLAGVGLERVRPLLAELIRAHLITEDSPGRFRFHDLLRAYAAELASAVDREAEQRAAIHRSLDHYLHTAHAAALLLDPSRPVTPLIAARRGVCPESITSYGKALDWFRSERAVLLASIQQAARTGFEPHIRQLVSAFRLALHRSGHWHEWVAAERAALAATQRLADRAGQAQSHHGLACALTRVQQYPEAERHFRCAIDLFAQDNDATGESAGHLKLAELLDLLDRANDALHHAELALVGYQAAGHRLGEARARNSIGWFHARLSNYTQALDSCQRALDALHELGDLNGQAETWDSLGFIRHGAGEPQKAADCYQRAVELFQELGDRYNEATTRTRLGDAHRAADDRRAARDAWRQALTILDQLCHADADRVRARLHRIGDIPD